MTMFIEVACGIILFVAILVFGIYLIVVGVMRMDAKFKAAEKIKRFSKEVDKNE